MKKYIIGIDEGTTSCRSVLYDITTNQIVAIANREFKSKYPKSGWVEQDAEDIWKKQLLTIREVIAKVNKEEIIAMGITNQRETVVAWDKTTGLPVCPAIVWQCRRTANRIMQISSKMAKRIKKKTGLIPDAYFSASKIEWLLKNEPKVQQLLKENKLCVGTMDSFLAFKLTGEFVTDTTNASRTMLYNINTLSWDKELLKYFNIPENILPKVISSAEVVGNVLDFDFSLASIIGDQQSSLFGQGCFDEGKAKATYGTGGFILFNTGEKRANVDNILTTISYTINGKTSYALEGSIYSASSTVNFMQHNLEFYSNPVETEKLASSVKNTGGVYFVPAFTGLGAPYWNSDARATIVGINFDTKKEHIVRAGLESMAYNTKAILDQMEKSGVIIKEIKVDGGCSKNGFLLQFLADMLNIKVIRNKESEATAMGAIFLACISTKVLSINKIKKNISSSSTFKSKILAENREKLYNGWQEAVKKILNK